MDTAQNPPINYKHMEGTVVPLLTGTDLQPMEDQGIRRKNKRSRVLNAEYQDTTPQIMNARKRT